MGAIALKLVGLGLPMLGTAIGGPFGGIVAGMIAKAIGAPAATPEAIHETMNTTSNDVLVQKLKSVESEYAAQVQAEAKVATADTENVNKTMQAEVQAALEIAKVGGRLGRFVAFLQISWRPVLAYETILEMFGGACVMGYEIITGNVDVTASMLQYSGFLGWYLSLKCGLLGFYSWNRTQEKVAGVGTTVGDKPSTGLTDAILKAIKSRVG